MKLPLLFLALLALGGCAGARFAVSLADAENTITVSHGDGKTIVELESENWRR